MPGPFAVVAVVDEMGNCGGGDLLLIDELLDEAPQSIATVAGIDAVAASFIDTRRPGS
jgi:hypothetical protein